MPYDDALFTLLQLVALLFPAIGLVMQGVSMIHRNRRVEIFTQDSFILARFSFIPLIIASIILLAPLTLDTSAYWPVRIAPIFISICLIFLFIAVLSMEGHGLRGLIYETIEIVKRG